PLSQQIRPLCGGLRSLAPQWSRPSRALPLLERKARLEKLISAANANWLRYSEGFDDCLKLLAEADRLGLEGIVEASRCALSLGKNSDWLKIKCATWREANKERWRLFERRS